MSGIPSFSIPYEAWDASVDSAGGISDTLTISRAPGGSSVVKLIWDTFTLTEGFLSLNPVATVTFDILGAAEPDAGICLVAGWNRSRPIAAADWSDTPPEDALSGLGLAAIPDSGSYTLRLENSTGVTRCTTGIVLGLQQLAVAGDNFLTIANAVLSFRIPASTTDSGSGTSGGDTGGSNDGKDTAVQLNRELALRSERLLAARTRPTVEYSTRLRSEGSARVAQ